MVQLVYDTIREPMRIVDIPVPVAKLLAAPRERFFKRVGPCTAYCHCSLQSVCQGKQLLLKECACARCLSF